MARWRRALPTLPPGRTLVTPRRARRAAAGLAAALLAAPGTASARSGCELIEVLLAKGDARLRGVGLVVNARGLVDVTLGSKPGALRGADHCSLDSPRSGFDLDCDWDYPAGEDEAAERDFAGMAARLNACLPTPLRAVAPVVYTEAQIKELSAKHGPSFEEYLRSHRKLGQYNARFPLDEDKDPSLDIELSLDRNDRNGNLEISVSFGRF